MFWANLTTLSLRYYITGVVSWGAGTVTIIRLLYTSNFNRIDSCTPVFILL